MVGGYEALKKFRYDSIVRMNRDAERKARLRGERHWGGGEWNKKSIQKIVDTIHSGADYQESPERICAKAIRIFVRSPQPILQPFGDCNHRTMTILTYTILDEFYPNIKPNRELWKGIRKRIDRMSEYEIERWIVQAIMEKTSIQSGSRSNLRSFSSNQRSNSSSVIKGKYAPHDIYSLWQLHAESITMEDYKSIKDRFYEAGWWTEARPSKRYRGRFDLYIRRR